MNVNNFEQLIELAKLKTTDEDILKILQFYFLENVEYDYIIEISSEPPEKPSNIKTIFASEEEKKQEILKFESQFGNNFHFSETDRIRLISILGNLVEPVKIQTKIGEQLKFINVPGYDGSVIDCLRQMSNRGPLYQNGLLIRGVCEQISEFTLQFCEHLNIKCKKAYCDNGSHVLNLIQINGEEKIFDFTRMLGIRDNYRNPNNSQTINDWFDMSYEKMFEYKPKRQITLIEGEKKFQNQISILNYKEYLSKKSFNEDSITSKNC